jgi:D-alanyl-lipoteichoic acid acyltransferase DltB (MBOAT superfamily)
VDCNEDISHFRKKKKKDAGPPPREKNLFAMIWFFILFCFGLVWFGQGLAKSPRLALN